MNKLKRLLIIPILALLLSINIVYARTGGNEATPEELVTSPNAEELYSITDTLIIRAEDIQYLEQVDFNRLSVLHTINISNTYFVDFSKLKINDNKYYLDAVNSVLDIRNVDLNKFESINFRYSYLINDGNVERTNTDVVNSDEYNIDPRYESQINKAAQEIYVKSDKTPESIIKEVTIYVLENMDYNFGPAYSSESLEEDFFEHHSGVCAHFAHMESVLLNKLGIFAIEVGGWVDDADPYNTSHAWTNVYLNNQWYAIDPTWMDQYDIAGKLNNQDPTVMQWYMRPINDSEFNTTHKYYFTSHDLIPLEERVSNTYLLNEEIPVYRLFNPINGEHLYTTDAYEVEVIYREQGWGKEGIGWYSAGLGTPVYRLYNPFLGNHLYTSDTYEISVITRTQGWLLDFDGAPVMYSSGDVPIYRLFNPGLQGQHHLTTDRNEYNVIPLWGWQQEGISMNAKKIGVPETTNYYR